MLLAVSAALNVVLYRLALELLPRPDGRPARPDRLGPCGPAPPPPAPVRRGIVYLGDSRVDLWAAPPAPEGCQVVNRGVGSETTEQVLLRLDRDVLALSPESSSCRPA